MPEKFSTARPARINDLNGPCVERGNGGRVQQGGDIGFDQGSQGISYSAVVRGHDQELKRASLVCRQRFRSSVNRRSAGRLKRAGRLVETSITPARFGTP